MCECVFPLFLLRLLCGLNLAFLGEKVTRQEKVPRNVCVEMWLSSELLSQQPSYSYLTFVRAIGITLQGTDEARMSLETLPLI